MDPKKFADINKSLDEMADLLSKSMKLAKDENGPAAEDKEAEAASQEAAPSAEPAGAEAAAPSADAADMAGAEAQDPDVGMAPESEMSLEQHAAAMSDEELHEFIEVLMKEAEKRQGAGEGGEGAPAEAAPAAEPAEKSMPMEGMMKSFEAALSKITESFTAKLNAVEEKLAKSQPAPAAPKAVVVNATPVSMNGDVLEKSAPKRERLTKSETSSFLINKMKEGNRLVDSDDVARVNATKTADQLYQIQDTLSKRGIEFPK